MGLLKNFTEKAFELVISAFAAMSEFAQKAKELRVSIKIDNLIEEGNANSKLATLAVETWIDLFSDKGRCELNGAINVHDIHFVLGIKEEKLIVTVESEYLKNQNPDSEVGKAFKNFLDDTNEMIDDLFDRDRSLNLPEGLGSLNRTKQVHELTEFFEDKLSSIYFRVLVNKFIAETKK